jgi:hypothetical protein
VRKAAALGCALLLAAPSSAHAHGLTGRADLPIPTWLFSWGAALVLIVSFVGLAVLWPQPRLEEDRFRPLPASLNTVLTSRVLDVLCGFVGVALFVVVLWSGLLGTEVIPQNLAPTFVYVGFWLGLVPLSVVFGDVFRAFNPWRAVGRLVGAVMGARAPEPLPYPERLGHWPAAVGLLGFAWLELVSSEGDRPAVIALAVVVYSTVTWLGMSLYGVESWSRRAEAFGVYFGLLARISPFERRGDQVGLRPLLSGLARMEPDHGLVAVLAVMVGSVSFDGLSGGPSWQVWLDPVLDFFSEDLGLGPKQALELSYALGLLASVGFVYGFYRLGIAGARTVDRRQAAGRLASIFVHSLVPIALAYVAAHYVSLLLFQGQALAPLASDPLGEGSNLFGTADWGIDLGFVSAEAFWYLQVGFVIVGHIAALALAHDRALTVYDDPRLAARSQYWMLTVMVGFTTLALWLLSEASKG